MAAPVGIVGTGQVGTAAAAALFHAQLTTELVLVDLDRRRARGEALDLMHGQALVGPCTVTSGDASALHRAAVVVIAAGVSQRPGEDRTALLGRNVAVLAQIIADLDDHAPEAVVIVATNPVDLLTDAAQRLSSRPPERILGTGTVLDSARLRSRLATRYGVSPRSIHAAVLGEHGDTELVAWSAASIGGVPLLDRTVNGVPWDPVVASEIEADVRRAAYEIIERKGHTNWAIGAVIEHLVTAVLRDERVVAPVSVRSGGRYGCADVCLGLPAVVGAAGVTGVLEPPLNSAETSQLRASAAALRTLLDAVDLPPAG